MSDREGSDREGSDREGADRAGSDREGSAREGSARERFLTRIRGRQGPPPTSGPHPPSPPPDVVPAMAYRNLDGVTDRAGLLAVFRSTVATAEATVDVVDDEIGLDDVVVRVVADHGVTTAVVSREPGLAAARAALERCGVAVVDYAPDVAADADLAVTSATHGIAATGSIVVDSRAAGSRAVSLLPRVHLCVLPADRLVATPSDVLRHPEPDGMPSCRVVITGPSRTGDIEQRLTLGAHGPVALHIVVT